MGFHMRIISLLQLLTSATFCVKRWGYFLICFTCLDVKCKAWNHIMVHGILYGIVLLSVYIKSLKLIARTLFALLLIPTAIKKNYLRRFCTKENVKKKFIYFFFDIFLWTEVEINVQQFVDYYSWNKYCLVKMFQGVLIAWKIHFIHFFLDFLVLLPF